jgi:hypothetical protein
MHNLQADAMTLAAARAAGELKQKLRDQGARFHEKRISDRRKAIADHLAQHPEIVKRAQADIERWTLAGLFGKARGGRN